MMLLRLKKVVAIKLNFQLVVKHVELPMSGSAKRLVCGLKTIGNMMRLHTILKLQDGLILELI